MLKNPSYLLCGANKKADAPRVIAEVISFKSSSRIKVLREHLIPLSESIRPFPYNVKQNFNVSFFQNLRQTEKNPFIRKFQFARAYAGHSHNKRAEQTMCGSFVYGI